MASGTKAKRRASPKEERPADLAMEAIASDRGTTGSLLDAHGQLPRDLVIEWPSITEIKAYPTNPRDNQPGIADVRDSLLNFGWQQPIVVDKHGVIIVGHTRYYAALDLQQTNVPVYFARHLIEAQAIAYRLADNKTAERSEWKFPLLHGEFAKLQGLGADLKSTGFHAFEWEPILAAHWTPPEIEHGPAAGIRTQLTFTPEEYAIVRAAALAKDESGTIPAAIVLLCQEWLDRQHL